MPQEVRPAESLRDTVYLVGSLDLNNCDDAALLLARNLAMCGLADGIRHDIDVYQRCSLDGNPVETNSLNILDVDALAFVFSQDRHKTLYRHCLSFAVDSTKYELDVDSKEIHALARGLFKFVRPYYYFYLTDNVHGRSKDPAMTKVYVKNMTSDAELKCFATSPNPVTSHRFVIR